jgi:hypothetical protein
MASQTDYTDLITSEHSSKPKYMNMVGASLQPYVDLLNQLGVMNALYDVDAAVGQQLDVCGQLVGVSRYLDVPLAGVYFAFDTNLVGFDQGVWLGPYDPITGLTTLPDDYYRVLIKVRILNNHWDGSKQSAYTLVNIIFALFGYSFFIEDHVDMTINLGLLGAGAPAAIAQALLTSGKFNVKPATVHISNYIYQNMAGPVFSFDINNTYFGGFDNSAWATMVAN